MTVTIVENTVTVVDSGAAVTVTENAVSNVIEANVAIPSKNVVAGVNISIDETDPNNPIINSLSDRYKTTSTTSHTIVSNGNLTFTVDSNLSYVSQQEVIIAYDANNHMHGTVVSYSGTSLVVDISHKTGSGTYASWSINLDGTPIDAITGSGTIGEMAVFTAARVIGSAALPVPYANATGDLDLNDHILSGVTQLRLKDEIGINDATLIYSSDRYIFTKPDASPALLETEGVVFNSLSDPNTKAPLAFDNNVYTFLDSAGSAASINIGHVNFYDQETAGYGQINLNNSAYNFLDDVGNRADIYHKDSWFQDTLTAGFGKITLEDESYVLTYNGTNLAALTAGVSYLSTVIASGGSALAPSYTFNGDTDTGIYLSAVNQISFATAGTQHWNITSVGNLNCVGTKTMAASLIHSAGVSGSASAPIFSFGFGLDTDTGMYRIAADTLGFSTGGTERLRIDSTGLVTFSNNIGIGTSPNSTWTLDGANATRAGFRFTSGTRQVSFVSFSADTNYMDSTGAALRIRTLDSSPVEIFTNGARRVTISAVNGSTHFGTLSFSTSQQLSVTPTATGTIGVVIRGMAAQTANLFEAQDSAGTIYTSITAAGSLRCGNSSATPITDVRSATATLDFPSIAAGAVATLTITVTGAVAGDTVSLGAPATLEAGLMFTGIVTAANTVTVRVHNTTAGAIDPASATWRATVIRF